MAESQPVNQEGATPNPEPVDTHSRRYDPNAKKSQSQWLAERKDQRAAARQAQEAQPEPQPQEADTPEPDNEPAPDPTPETQDSLSADDQTEEAPVQEAEVSQEQTETDEERFPETLGEYAQALEVDLDDFLQATTHKVKVNGVEQEVSLKELARNYSSEGERSRHVQELADQRKTLEVESAKQAQEWQNRLQQADQFLAAMQAAVDLGPTDEQLIQQFDGDEFGYLKARTERDAKLQKLQQALGERQKLVEQAQMEQTEKQAEFRKRQQDGLLDWQPDLRDPSKMSAYESKLRTGLQQNGYEAKDIDNFFAAFDLRALKMVDKALKYDELMSREKPIRQKLKQLPKIQKGGNKRSDAQLANDQVLSARNRLKSSGSRHDAVKWLQARRAQRNLQHGGSQ